MSKFRCAWISLTHKTHIHARACVQTHTHTHMQIYACIVFYYVVHILSIEVSGSGLVVLFQVEIKRTQIKYSDASTFRIQMILLKER